MTPKKNINLVFDGINTIANVSINGHQLCACKNLFTRFVFPVSHLLQKVQIYQNNYFFYFRTKLLKPIFLGWLRKRAAGAVPIHACLRGPARCNPTN
jgi:hypothetical protein